MSVLKVVVKALTFQRHSLTLYHEQLNASGYMYQITIYDTNNDLHNSPLCWQGKSLTGIQAAEQPQGAESGRGAEPRACIWSNWGLQSFSPVPGKNCGPRPRVCGKDVQPRASGPRALEQNWADATRALAIQPRTQSKTGVASLYRNYTHTRNTHFFGVIASWEG